MKAIGRFFGLIYGVWSFLVLTSSYVVMGILTLPFLLHPKLYPVGHFINRVWGMFLHLGTMIPIFRKGYKKIDGPAVYVANHTSYIDISSLFLILPGYFNIIGKGMLGRVPIFGAMFSRLYITVDRRDRRSKIISYQKSLATIDKGRSLFIFPEGTIPSKGAPHMIPFKDGAFKIAIEKQVPIVPMVSPYNWKILSDNNFRDIRWHWIEVIFHEPIETKGLTLKDVDALKEKVFNIMDKTIKEKNKLT